MKENELLNNYAEFRYKLLEWYHTFQRELPWRKQPTPYIVWISEVILQQTRVDQGIDYFFRFIERFPKVQDLASAKEDEVLKYWQGLGYYSRARNLHAAAKQIMNEYNGVLPSDYKSLKSLPGIGDYTASAILSFAYNKPYPPLDGNVFRVLSRLFGIEKPIDANTSRKLFLDYAMALQGDAQPSQINQAVMEFGALQCVPQNPHCEECPLSSDCIALALDKVQLLPIKKNRLSVRNRYIYYLNIQKQDSESLFMIKRPDNDIWRGLYDLPWIETPQLYNFEAFLKSTEFKDFLSKQEVLKIKPASSILKHRLSHQLLHVQYCELIISKEASIPDEWQEISFSEVETYPVSKLLHNYLNRFLNSLYN